MKKARPLYETSYKLEVAKMVVDQGLTISQVCKDLTIGSSAIARWVKQYHAEMHDQPNTGFTLPNTKNESESGEYLATKGASCFSSQKQDLFNSPLLQALWIKYV